MTRRGVTVRSPVQRAEENELFRDREARKGILRISVMVLVGGMAWSGRALAQQPINLFAPPPLSPPGAASIERTPLPPPRAGMSLPMEPAIAVSNEDMAIPYLEAAETSLAARRYATAREQLEQAETRLLNNGAVPNQVTISGDCQALQQVQLAREAAIRHDRQTGLTVTGIAISAAQEASQQSQSPVIAGAPVPPPPPSPSVPMITKALLAGHWQLSGWEYHWVPPETQQRPLETRPFVQGRYVWQDGTWTWVPSHYGNDRRDQSEDQW
jgi:hypothetical protein